MSQGHVPGRGEQELERAPVRPPAGGEETVERVSEATGEASRGSARRTPEPPARRGPSTRARLRAALASRHALGDAVLLAEVLGPPVSRRSGARGR